MINFTNISRGARSGTGFTLIELLIVVAIIAVLGLVVFLVINPAEVLRSSRDALRLSDMSQINKAVNLVRTDNPNAYLGSSTVVYISLPDSSPTCASYTSQLPALPSGWSYSCVPSATLRKNNGAGWLPVDLTGFSSGAPLPTIPVDPVNTLANHYYYSYVPSGSSWEVDASIESSKYQPTAQNDGGTSATTLETGPSKNLNPSKCNGIFCEDFEQGLAKWDRQLLGGSDGSIAQLTNDSRCHGGTGCLMITVASASFASPPYLISTGATLSTSSLNPFTGQKEGAVSLYLMVDPGYQGLSSCCGGSANVRNEFYVGASSSVNCADGLPGGIKLINQNGASAINFAFIERGKQTGVACSDPGAHVGGAMSTLTLGQWYKITIYSKAATTPVSGDGVIQGYINGSLVASESNSLFDASALNLVGFGPYKSITSIGSFYIDDITVYNNLPTNP